MGDRNPFSYLMVKGEGSKGASYKYTWKPDWRLPPGVRQGKVFLQVLGICAVAAVPIYLMPLLSGKSEEQLKKENVYMAMKKKAREERMKWIKDDGMPYK